jgi:hypothetical protein
MKQAIVNSRQHSHARDDTTKHMLPVPCQYMFSLMNFIVNNPDNFQTNPSVHSIHIMRKYNPHRPNANLSCFFRKVHSMLAS